MLDAAGLDLVARPAVFHAQIGRDLAVGALDGGDHFDGAQAIEGDHLVGRDDEAHRAAQAGAELGAHAQRVAPLDHLPGLICRRARLDQPGHRHDRGLELLRRRGGRGLISGRRVLGLAHRGQRETSPQQHAQHRN